MYSVALSSREQKTILSGYCVPWSLLLCDKKISFLKSLSCISFSSAFLEPVARRIIYQVLTQREGCHGKTLDTAGMQHTRVFSTPCHCSSRRFSHTHKGFSCPDCP